ncbi:MAG TPA: hypothetical protein VGD65_13820 [Chryseosolibacter sp.]
MTNLQTPTRGWGKQKAKLKSLYPALLETDFVYEYGQKEVMMENLQRKIGTTRSGLMEMMTEMKTKKRYFK